MDPKILTENGWKANVLKFKLKDKELQRALLVYENLKDDDFDSRSKAMEKIVALAAGLKKDKEVAPNAVLVKYLTDMVTAGQTAQRDITKAKVEAEKAKALAQKKTNAEAAKQEQEAQKAATETEEDETEEEEGDSFVKLTTALKTLKLSKKPYYFLVCDAKPYGLIVSRKDIRKSAQAKKELTKIAGGSTRAPKFGECRCEGGKYVFEMEKPPSGLARILQKWIKECTGLGIKVMVGTESADDDGEKPVGVPTAREADVTKPGEAASASPEAAAGAGTPPKGPLSLGASVGRGGKNKAEDVTAVQTALNTRAKAGLPVNGKCDPATIKAIEEFQKLLGQLKPDGLIEPGRGTARALASTAKLGPAPAPPQPIAPPKLPKATLANAPEVWDGTRAILDTNIKELKKGIRAHYGTEHPEFLKALDENLVKLDVILDKLDHRLEDSLAKAHAAKDETARKAELKNSKIILIDYLKYVKSEPMIAHIDANPFGVKTNLKQVLTDSLTHMAKAIG